MGRLFWKLFFGFWLTLIVAGLAVGFAVRLHQQATSEHGEDASLAAGGRAEWLVESAAATLRFGGEAALRALLEDARPRAAGPPLRLYAVDEEGRELLGRDLPAGLLEEARGRAAEGRRGVRLAESPEGRRLLLLVPLPDASGAAHRHVARPVEHQAHRPVLVVVDDVVWKRRDCEHRPLVREKDALRCLLGDEFGKSIAELVSKPRTAAAVQTCSS